MIKNKIIDTYPDAIESITSEAKAKNFYLVNLDGRTIQTKQEYIDTMSVNFKFPYGTGETYDGYFDWIRDLGWLIDKGYNGFVLIIDYYKSFLANEPYNELYLEGGRIVHKFKEYLEIEGFNDITTHWEYEIIKIISGGGVPRSFNIYLVDR